MFHYPSPLNGIGDYIIHQRGTWYSTHLTKVYKLRKSALKEVGFIHKIKKKDDGKLQAGIIAVAFTPLRLFACSTKRILLCNFLLVEHSYAAIVSIEWRAASLTNFEAYDGRAESLCWSRDLKKWTSWWLSGAPAKIEWGFQESAVLAYKTCHQSKMVHLGAQKSYTKIGD